MTDVIVVGGGVIGLSIAYELAGQGVAVTILERGQFGQEASWAGAGILPPGNPVAAVEPAARLRAASHVRWEPLSRQLRSDTGIDNGFRNCGGIAVQLHPTGDALQNEIDAWRREAVEIEELPRARLLEAEPSINPAAVAGYRLPQLCQVRNPRHLKALLAGCATRGVELVPGAAVTSFDREHEKIVAVRTVNGVYRAGQFCVAGGAWSEQLMAEAGCQVSIKPVRGQIVLLSMQPLPFRHVIEVGSRYLVPRPDGRILIGSTEEHVGFDKRNTAGAVAELIRFATEVVPCLTEARYERAWCGLRPLSADGLPYIGRVPGMENLFVAAGHFRSGLQTSPATALLMRQLMLSQPTSIPLEPFSVDRRPAATVRS